MKTFSLKIVGRSQLVEFSEREVQTYEDFADSERDDVLKLRVDQSITFSDGAKVTRLS